MKRMTKAIGIGASIALLGSAFVASSASASAETATQRPMSATCDLVEQPLSVTNAAPHETLTQQFTDYGDSGEGWTGADSTYSLELSDGRQAWFFSDTFLGPVNADGSRPVTATFLNNSIVVDDGGTLSTVTGGTALEPEAIVPPTADGKWHWVGDPELTRTGEVHVPVMQYEKFGPSLWDFRWAANRLAILDGKDLTLTQMKELPSASGINWGGWTMTEGSKTYVYGINDVAGVRSAFMARVTGNRGLEGSWKFWDGTRWSPREQDATPVASYVANEFSVSALHDGYLLVTQDTTWPFDSRVVAQVSCSPTGPFVYKTELYRMPEAGPWGSYGDGDVYAYNAHEHPELREGNTILVSHNVNTFDAVGDIYDDVTIYRPRFWEISLSVG